MRIMKNTKLAFAIFSVICVRSVTGLAAQSSIFPVFSPLRLTAPVRDKNFYLCKLLDTSPAQRALQQDTELANFTEIYRNRLRAAVESCALKTSCYLKAARLTDDEIETHVLALERLYSQQGGIREAARELRRSGTMIRFDRESDPQLLATAWRLSAFRINGILSTYGEGTAPLAGSIDAMSLNPNSDEFGAALKTAVRVVLETDPRHALFFSDAVQFAVLVLMINARDEAGRLEPLEQGENRLAIQNIARTKWGDYRYPLIVVPGAGPDHQDERLAPGGRLRLELAVAQYRKGIAPFILVSGGFVHPPRAPFNEAIEMKRALVDEYHVPPSAVLIEPYARHTTTNIRNSVRLLYRYQIPFNGAILVVTDEFQADGMMDGAFDDRNLRETSILPYTSKKRVSPTEIEFVPNIKALQLGWLDPLDP